MADVSDVSDTIVGLVSGLLYPSGTSQPSVIAGTAGMRVYDGWPVPHQLDLDLANKVASVLTSICHVSVYPLPGERNTTRYFSEWTMASLNTPTLILSSAGQTVRVGGTVPPANNPHNLVVFVNKYPYVYAAQPTDSLSTIATALATLIAVNVPGTTSASAVITLPANAVLGPCRVGITGTSTLEVARQEKQFQISIWADSPAHRVAMAKVIDPALKGMAFIMLPDLSGGRFRYVGMREIDMLQKQAIYRRDLIYTVEYGTFLTLPTTQVTQVEIDIAPEMDGTWSADGEITTDSEDNTTDAIPFGDPNSWSVDSVETIDSTSLTTDSAPLGGVTIYQ